MASKKQVPLATHIGCEHGKNGLFNPRREQSARWWAQTHRYSGLSPRATQRRDIGIDAKGGLGKGWITQTLIMSACTGKTLLETFIPDGPMKVLWLESEDPESELHRRFKKIAAAYEFTEWDLHRCSENLIAFPGQSFPLTRPASGSVEPTEHYEWVYGKVKEYQPRLIVLDPRSHYYGGDENDNTQVGRFMGLLKELTSAVDKGAAVWVNHHTSKEREQQSSAGSWRIGGRDAQRTVRSLRQTAERRLQGSRFTIHICTSYGKHKKQLDRTLFESNLAQTGDRRTRRRTQAGEFEPNGGTEVTDYTRMREWLETITPEMLPKTPWELKPFVYVVDNARFLKMVTRECKPGSPRPMTAATEEDCKALYRRVKR